MADKKSRTKKKPAPKKKPAKKQDSENTIYVPTARSGIVRNIRIIRRYWKPFGLATLVYGLLYFVFIRVLTNVDFNQLNASVVAVFGGGEESIATRTVAVGTLFGQSAQFDNQTGVLFFVIAMVASLAIIWLLRALWSSRKLKVKEAYYQGMYPFVPVVLVVLVMFLQAIPFSIGTFLFQTAFDQGLAASFIEKLGFVSVLMAGIILSSYWIIGSIMAFYAATVPGKTPLESLDIAKQMLKGRRFAVLKEALIFMVVTGLMILIPMLAVIYVFSQAAVVLAAIFIVISLPWMHMFFYGLYRDLLNE